ncbi:MAG TPA: 30S ribosomal protein S12 methylthiotransferase RimO [Gemmatales bacterium]|nr:30S ribosomal protein S12 methylthiotransferase RimO [Gemmatales bacterium]HMP60183.1 30S ribosomal protein S12 methylthiotransferase RimO [Gemmatales bacterium]
MSAPLKGSLAFVTLGCAKNLVDSEAMLGQLTASGYALQASPEEADVVVVNTCGFIEAARQESLGVIEEMLELKRQGKVRAVVVAGCLAERKKEELLQEVPEVDHLVGVFGREEIAAVCDQVLAGRPATATTKPAAKGRKRSLALPTATDPLTEQRTLFRPAPIKALNDQARLRITPRHFAYLKISEGCDRLCTFCAIPGMRGKHVTKPIEQVVAEARELAADGVRELILVAQDTTYYGLDLYGRVRLHELLEQLDQIDGLDWIRILYVYPMYLTDELLRTLGSARKIIPYIDMPLQHISDPLLRRMARRVTRAETEDLIGRLRQAVPGLTMRTTFIVGFPGETDEHFTELCDFVETARFERMGVFTYSLEPGTPAVKLEDHVSEDVKEERRGRLMEVQQGVAFAWAKAQVGRELEAIIDGPDGEAPGWYVGRGTADAPDIDPIVKVKGKNLAAGDIARVKITSADGYDLLGRSLSVR